LIDSAQVMLRLHRGTPLPRCRINRREMPACVLKPVTAAPCGGMPGTLSGEQFRDFISS
jgi:hypothetical protein